MADMKLVTSSRKGKATSIAIGHHINALGRVDCPQIQDILAYKVVTVRHLARYPASLQLYSLFEITDGPPSMPSRIRLCRTCFKKRFPYDR